MVDDLAGLDDVCARLCRRVESLKTMEIFIDTSLLSRDEQHPTALIQNSLPQLRALGVLDASAISGDTRRPIRFCMSGYNT